MFTMRPTGPPQLRLFGIPVRIEPMFWFVTVAIGLLGGGNVGIAAGWVLIVGLSLLLHELGHAAAFLAFGSRPVIVLHGLGGVTVARSPERRWQSVVVSLAGSVVPLLLVGVPAIVARAQFGDPRDARSLLLLLDMAVWVNVYWGLANLLPLVPLDGGHVVEQFAGPRWARIVTIAVAVPVLVAAYLAGLVFGAVIAGVCALQAYAQLRAPALAEPAPGASPAGPDSPSTATGPGSGGRPPTMGEVEAAARQALAVAPHDGWARGTVELIEGRTVAALRTMEDAARHGPPPAPAVALLGDEGMARRLAERLLERPGERSAGAVAEIASGLLAADRPGPAALVAERLAADRRSPALSAWAANLAASAWDAAGDAERARRWRSAVGGP